MIMNYDYLIFLQYFTDIKGRVKKYFNVHIISNLLHLLKLEFVFFFIIILLFAELMAQVAEFTFTKLREQLHLIRLPPDREWGIVFLRRHRLALQNFLSD